MNTRLLSLASLALISYANGTPETCTTTSGATIAAWYDGDSYNEGTAIWADKMGNADTSTTSHVSKTTSTVATDELYLNGQAVLWGGTDSAVVFNTNVPQTHTVFNLCKYKGAGARGRIITAHNCNCLFGFWANHAGVAHEGAWLNYPGVTTDPERTDWVLSAQTNLKYRMDGVDATTGHNNGGWAGSTLANGVGKLGIHTGIGGNEKSAWACAELLVFNVELPENEIVCIEQYFSAKYAIPIDGEVYDPCAGVDCGGECGSCDAQTGACVYDDGVCNDNDLCNGEETCDTATGTCVEGTASECADGDPCNGEESCDPVTGDCIPGTDDLTCDAGFICKTGEGCKRNCDLFAIDGYLEECSVVMSDSQQELVDLEETLTAANDAQDTVIASAGVDIAALQGEDNAIYAILGEYSTVEEGDKENVYAQLEAITTALSAFGINTKYGEVSEGQSVIGVPQMGGVGQNNFIILLLISNMVLVVALIAVVCWYRTKLHTVRYETVKYYSSAADEENVQLNK